MGIPIGGGGYGIEPLASSAIADGATAVLRTTLPRVVERRGTHMCLTQAVLRVDENADADTLVAEAGPVWAELWLIRYEGVQVLLDKGFIRGGGARGLHSVVGVVGSIAYSGGDFLVALLANDSGASVTVRLERAAIERTVPVADGFDRLSTEPTALFAVEFTIANEAAQGASSLELILTPAAGDAFDVLYGRITNLDTVARTATAEIDDGTAGTFMYRIMSESQTAGNSVHFPSNKTAADGTPGGGAGVPMPVESPMRLTLRLASVADGQDGVFAVVVRIKGRAPAITTLGAGTEVVTDTLSRVL